MNRNMKKKHKGFVLWFTGFSGAGKSTIADAVYEKLNSDGYNVERLDGDIVRENLTKDLGFTKEDRAENIKRVAFVVSLLAKHSIVVVASFISPYKKERDLVRSMCKNFIEVYISTPLKICEKRDPKGLYAKARRGEIKDFTGISDPYEVPKNPEIKIYGDKKKEIRKNVDTIIRYLEKTILK